MVTSTKAADRHAKQLLQPISSPEVNKIVANQQVPYPKGSFKGGPRQPKPRKSNTQSGKQTSCHRCGGTDHWDSDCKVRQTVCHNCNKKGTWPRFVWQANLEANSMQPVDTII